MILIVNEAKIVEFLSSPAPDEIKIKTAASKFLNDLYILHLLKFSISRKSIANLWAGILTDSSAHSFEYFLLLRPFDNTQLCRICWCWWQMLVPENCYQQHFFSNGIWLYSTLRYFHRYLVNEKSWGTTSINPSKFNKIGHKWWTYVAFSFIYSLICFPFQLRSKKMKFLYK